MNRPCPHRRVILACITCGQPPHRHQPCLCQDFRTICASCRTLARHPTERTTNPMKFLSFVTLARFNNVRAILYAATPAILGALVDGQVLTQDHANLWLAATVAVLSPGLAAVNAPAGLKTYLYGLLAPVQGLLVGLGIFTNQQVTPWIGVATALISSGLAAANVHTRSASDTTTGT